MVLITFFFLPKMSTLREFCCKAHTTEQQIVCFQCVYFLMHNLKCHPYLKNQLCAFSFCHFDCTKDNILNIKQYTIADRLFFSQYLVGHCDSVADFLHRILLPLTSMRILPLTPMGTELYLLIFIRCSGQKAGSWL